jgi:hypothetical protein
MMSPEKLENLKTQFLENEEPSDTTENRLEQK